MAIDRRSQPSLLMIGKELDDVLRQRYGSEPGTTDFHDVIGALAAWSFFCSARGFEPVATMS